MNSIVKTLGFGSLTLKKLQIIQKYPERCPKRKGNFRETPVKVFPYFIVYTFYKTEGDNCKFYISQQQKSTKEE